MKIKLLRNTRADGNFVSQGDVIELSDNEGRYLIRMKKAEETKEPVGKAKKPAAAPVKEKSEK